jgi:4-hydroxybenzoate polyprenyltransferase
MASRRSAVRLIRLRLEALFWLTRPQSAFSYLPIALAAWSIGRGRLQAADLGDFALLLLALMILQAAMFVLNDIFDAHNDSITAPFMPIPSGLVSRRAATGMAFALGVTMVALILVVAPTPTSLVLVLAMVPAALATFKLYSATKGYWFSPLLEISTFTSAAVLAWLLAGGAQPDRFVVLFVIAAIHGIEANVRSQMRDVEGDPRAGNITLVARLGLSRSVWLLASIRTIEIVFVGVLWLIFGSAGGVIWLMLAMAMLVIAASRSHILYEEASNRVHQAARLSSWSYGAFCVEVAVLGVLYPAVAAFVAAFMFAWYRLVRARYYDRIARGHLATDIEETMSESV